MAELSVLVQSGGKETRFLEETGFLIPKLYHYRTFPRRAPVKPGRNRSSA
jgi:hypothetical protein